jgi:glycine betaine catabolism B
VNVLPNAADGRPVPRRFELPFLDHRAETPTSMTFRFSTDGSGFEYRSNQAIRLILPWVQDPWGPARSFSLSSSPSEAGAIAITAKMTGSPYKEALRNLTPADRVLVFGPVGDLLYAPSRSSLFVAGGIGVTPFRGMLKYASDTGAGEPITMLYSARTPEELAFRGELDALAEANPRFRVRYTITRPADAREPWTGRIGRIDEAWLREELARLHRPKVYVVGLPEMAEEVLATLRDRLGVAEDDLEYEYFRGY